MTRKHFQLIADALSISRPIHPDNLPDSASDALYERAGLRYRQWRDDVDRISDALATTNPNYDADRFKEACNR